MAVNRCAVIVIVLSAAVLSGEPALIKPSKVIFPFGALRITFSFPALVDSIVEIEPVLIFPLVLVIDTLAALIARLKNPFGKGATKILLVAVRFTALSKAVKVPNTEILLDAERFMLPALTFPNTEILLDAERFMLPALTLPKVISTPAIERFWVERFLVAFVITNEPVPIFAALAIKLVFMASVLKSLLILMLRFALIIRFAAPLIKGVPAMNKMSLPATKLNVVTGLLNATPPLRVMS